MVRARAQSSDLYARTLPNRMANEAIIDPHILSNYVLGTVGDWNTVRVQL